MLKIEVLACEAMCKLGMIITMIGCADYKVRNIITIIIPSTGNGYSQPVIVSLRFNDKISLRIDRTTSQIEIGTASVILNTVCSANEVIVSVFIDIAQTGQAATEQMVYVFSVDLVIVEIIHGISAEKNINSAGETIHGFRSDHNIIESIPIQISFTGNTLTEMVKQNFRLCRSCVYQNFI